MALTGDAKTAYMREYMRKRRAAEATNKPKGEPQQQHKQQDAHATARVRELEATLQARDKQIAALKAELVDTVEQARASRDERKRPAAKPKAERPPLPPDEARDKKIKALTTENRNLKKKMIDLSIWYTEALATTGGMNFATQSAIAKCLHPDKDPPTNEERNEAFKLFSAWKSDNRAARPTGSRARTRARPR
jgi:hypothetical protein